MNTPNEIGKRMEYIQKVFLGIQEQMQKNSTLNEVISLLDSEPQEFRSVAYESASMEIGLNDLHQKNGLTEWTKFYHLSKETHSFHMEIGLGWAFAKTEIDPTSHLEGLDPLMQWMVFDGLGYYCGLFKGRRTIKNQQVPELIHDEQLIGFDQGLGRRLWYISKGEVSEVNNLVQSFPLNRQGNLWRGVGIACGYVGGSDRTNLKQLATYSSVFKQQICTGVALAALSRNLSKTLTKDIELACEIICNKSVKEVLNAEACVRGKFNSKSGNFYRTWLSLLEEEFN